MKHSSLSPAEKRAKAAEKMRLYRAAHPEYRARQVELNRQWREANREHLAAYQKAYVSRQRQIQRRRRGMIDAPQDTKAGACPVCLREGELVLDHDRRTGRIRGWLRRRCNGAFGHMGDDIAAAHRLVTYLAVEI